MQLVLTLTLTLQLVLTPIHLLALNIYNEPKAALAERAQQVGRTRT